MKVKSLALEGAKLSPVEVELILSPGLPQIHFLGLPDQIIKESIHRIKSAIRNQGFEFPKTKQIVVNIRPSHTKKSSRGVELAVAAALLWETGQLPAPTIQEDFFIYGELGLSGEVFEPEDLKDFNGSPETVVLTGASNSFLSFTRNCIESLKDLNNPVYRESDKNQYKSVRPTFGLEINYPKEQGRLIEILALGGFHALLAGPSGSGKSTLAKALISFLEEPTMEERVLRRQMWRPMVSPHHSISNLSLIGGGAPPKPGEISRADGGLLIMDELLEFSTSCQEALREPIEEGSVRVSRGLKTEIFPARVQLIATTNLCPCGQWVPGRHISCRFSRSRCTSYQQRLSGPFLDRFEILYFTKKVKTSLGSNTTSQVKGSEILKKLSEVRRWKKEAVNLESEKRIDAFLKSNILPEDFSSLRRQKACLRVAACLADLDQSEVVKAHHLDEALKLTKDPFDKLSCEI